ncbi:MAG: ATP-binding protein [Planctomycetota bacterium]|nr:ATP-binding protein [Planctomycetota bacterium]
MSDAAPRIPTDFEKLGLFYLGRAYDLAQRKAKDELVLYESKDLVTHAVCVGMTGSGKTGLCIGLLEEAAIDGIPAILIDPKGDLANLALTFPELRPEDFQPWINEDDARRKGMTSQDYAAKQAQTWRTGLESWGQGADRIKKFRDAADVVIYTPGSSAGIPVSIMKSFGAPEQSILDDGELLQERVRTTATSLLSLLGIDADPVQSREHILISTIFNHAWQNGQDLDLAALIGQIQSPPVQRVGVLDLDSFFPAKERFTLAMRLNNLLAAPGFENWMKGEPLDVGLLLYTPAGKPKLAVFSIAHLGDAERMFFVSLLLNQVVGWMRTQSGTTSLRAILYMDEIFGYFPPVSNPPSKAPLLTLLKQARAYGVGVVLATQNPVDLDYKGLANAGTWFIGRLQTERDKMRVLEGLEGAAASASSSFDRQRMEQTLAGLGSRIFLMNNVHEDGPEVFESRWVMSYLRGPLTRDQIKKLSASQHNSGMGVSPMQSPAKHGRDAHATGKNSIASGATNTRGSAARPVFPPDVPQYFIPIRDVAPHGATHTYVPTIIACATVHFADKSGNRQQTKTCLLAPLTKDATAPDWQSAAEVDLAESDLEREPAPDRASFVDVPAAAARSKNYAAWSKSLIDTLYRTSTLELLTHPEFKLTAKPGESARDFRARVAQAVRERRDDEMETLRRKYQPKFAAMTERIRRAEQAVARESAQASQAKMSTAVSIGATILGAVFGRKKLSTGTIGRAGTAARGVGRAAKESGDIARAEETVRAAVDALRELEHQFESDSAEVATRSDAAATAIETVPVRPKKSDITIEVVALTWTPHWQQGTELTPAWG